MCILSGDLYIFYSHDKEAANGFIKAVKEFLARIKAFFEKIANMKSTAEEAQKFAQMGSDIVSELQKLFDEGVLAMREGNMARNAANLQKNTKSAAESQRTMYQESYQFADTNSDILSMISKVADGNFKANEKVNLGTVLEATATEIYNITGIDVKGFKVAIEARQIEHIIKDHGKNGKTDKSMANPSDIAKIEYVLRDYDDIRPAGKTQAYTQMVKDKNRTADTVLYEKSIGEKSYYVVQAVPDTKAKTLYIVTAFIGKKGYKKEASQLINAKSLDVTAKTDSVNASNNSIPQNQQKSSDFEKNKILYRERDADYLDAVNRGDMKAVEKMVDEAAKEVGYNVKAYHGSKEDFTIFDHGKIGSATGVGMLGEGFYFADKKNVAKGYGNKLYTVYLKAQKPYVATESDICRINSFKLQEQGYDSIRFSTPKGTVYSIFENTQIKSADPVTYDDNGKVIPLSERFNAEQRDIRYQEREEERISIGMTDSERSRILKNAKITPPEISINEAFDVDFQELERNNWKAIKKPMLDKLRDLGYLKSYRTDIVDVSFDFTGEGLRKSMNAQVSDYGGNLSDLAKVVMNIQPLLDNSVLLEIHADKAKGTSKENPQLLQTYVLLSAFREGETITPVQFEIKQYVDDNNRLYLAVALTKIETDVISDTILENQASTRLLPVSDISIPQLIAKINPKDENFFKYIPNDLLSAEQIEAKKRALSKEAAKYGRQSSENLLQRRTELPTSSEILAEVFKSGKAYERYADHSQSLKKYKDLQVRLRNSEKRIAEIEGYTFTVIPTGQ